MQSQKEGSVLMVNKVFLALTRQTSGLKSEATEVVWLAENLPLFAVLLFFFLFPQTGLTHPQLEAISSVEASAAAVDGE